MDELELIRQKKLKEMMQKMSGEEKARKVLDSPVKLNSSNFDETLKNNENVVVDFWAEWCMPCKMIAPVIEELAKEYAGKVVFGKLNTDENPTIAARYGISAIPTLIFFKKGKPVDQLVGAMPKSELKRWVQRNL
ncbi:thioredoxin [Archaeoglobus fulgidus]|jgi:thioredoxin 1|uniref:Thioredoxin (Trx-3) n=3 Tax=Archaeoglobus fulgidus TaxID=2234 RepID=O28984_ARCFU|nr:thioredoxin [Archaeoglobus fulgidus]AAB89961.1 thioredoxin (trx-3) [Archaeoglobus fulgidus DSM 4304]AIG98163.1 thioredoxin [Archaeoglobus fulgidus DSM 8774]KUJ92913.1 MAG: Thioredoxin (Trx-3) [Archaeoglobus fulgidus]KUK06392.1 MAG: Thioredoxin (Trx-3) [Archaeoglobus fulgidus]